VRRVHHAVEIYEGDEGEDDDAFAAWVIEQYDKAV
jgi:hypothetical protein